MSTLNTRCWLASLFLSTCATGWAQTTAKVLSVTAAELAKNEAAARYRLFPGDMIRVTVFGEDDLNVERRLDGNGALSLPLIGNVSLLGLRLADAAEKIRQTFIAMEILVRPQVSVSVTEYGAKEVSVTGQVKNPGKVSLPIEGSAIEIVDVIGKAGGFTRLGRSDDVRVTRKASNGRDETFTVNVQRIHNGRGGSRSFAVFPGDVIFVPERLF